MSTGTVAAPAKKTSLFGKKEQKFLKDPLWDTNPITHQVLGICSALAVTSSMKPAIVMAISVTVVLIGSNVIISMLRNMIPTKIRIIVMLAIVSTLVTLVDQLLKAYMFDLSKELSVFVGLIITNCIVLGRAEAFALANKPWPSLLDGLGNGLGYSIILILVAIGRELLGNGTLLGIHIVPQALYEMGYSNAGLMILPPGAFILLGLLVWGQRAISNKVEG
jgi:Na+-transporting NADH:ubiquinone oxidoreductase subunit D